MAGAIKSGVSALAGSLKKTAKKSPTLRRIAYNVFNASHFSNLFEHEQLLADTVRCDTYAQAIAKHIKPGSTVIDVGTGTGFLAMLAARVPDTHVYALDHSNMIELAEKVARANGFENITFVNANSRSFTPDEKIDVVLHEQIGDDLFDENMVDNLLDLKHRVMVPDGLILPGRFQLFVEPVAMHPDFDIPLIDELKVQGLDFSVLGKEAATYGLIPDDYFLRFRSADAFGHKLTEPEPAVDFDLNQMQSASEIPDEIEFTRTIVADGRMSGFGIWFNCIFDEGNQFDTSPFSRHTHWAYRLYRAPAIACRAGDVVKYKLTMPDIRRAETWTIKVI